MIKSKFIFIVLLLSVSFYSCTDEFQETEFDLEDVKIDISDNVDFEAFLNKKKIYIESINDYLKSEQNVISVEDILDGLTNTELNRQQVLFGEYNINLTYKKLEVKMFKEMELEGVMSISEFIELLNVLFIEKVSEGYFNDPHARNTDTLAQALAFVAACIDSCQEAAERAFTDEEEGPLKEIAINSFVIGCYYGCNF